MNLLHHKPALQAAARRVTVVEASFDRPLQTGELEAMARRRYQDPEPELVGNWWQIRVYRDEYVNGRRIRKRKRIRLAPASMAVREVQKLKSEYLRPLNQGLISEGAATPFESFVRSVGARARHESAITMTVGPES